MALSRNASGLKLPSSDSAIGGGLNDPVDLHSGAAYLLCNSSLAKAVSVQCHNLASIKSLFPSLIDTVAFGLLDAVALAFLDEPSLHLSDHSQNGQDDVAHFPPRHVRVEHRDERTLLLALVNQVELVSSIAGEPVKASHHQLITGTKKIQTVASSVRPWRVPPETFSERMTWHPV